MILEILVVYFTFQNVQKSFDRLTIALNFDAHGSIGDFEGTFRNSRVFFDFAFCRANNIFAVILLKKPEALMHEGRRHRLGKLKVGEHHGDHRRWVSCEKFENAPRALIMARQSHVRLNSYGWRNIFNMLESRILRCLRSEH